MNVVSPPALETSTRPPMLLKVGVVAAPGLAALAFAKMGDSTTVGTAIALGVILLVLQEVGRVVRVDARVVVVAGLLADAVLRVERQADEDLELPCLADALEQPGIGSAPARGSQSGPSSQR